MEESWGLQDYSRGEPDDTASVDPVCGMTVNDKHALGGHAHYGGEIFYFCSDFCRKQFEQDPGRYIGQSTQP